MQNMSITEETIDANKQIIRTFYEDCLNRGRLDRVEELLAPDFMNPTGEGGAAAFRGRIDLLRSAFPDIRFTIEDVIAEGDRVVVRTTWVGTHTGAFRGVAATHKRVTDAGITIYRVEGGRLAQVWLQTDRLGVLQQIGVVPADQ